MATIAIARSKSQQTVARLSRAAVAGGGLSAAIAIALQIPAQKINTGGCQFASRDRACSSLNIFPIFFRKKTLFF